MNVIIEDLSPCRKLVRVEIEAQEVDKTFDSVARDFQKQATLPGFRPGKAPKEMVFRKYEKDIEGEVKRKLISDSYRKAIEEKSLDVLGQPDIEEIQFLRGKPLQYAATVETAPQFELPQYKGLKAKRETRSVTDADLERAMAALREPRGSYENVDRAIQNGDIAVINYKGTCDGKPISEISPAAKGLAEKENFWIEVPSGAFIPGFSEQLTGAKAGDQRTVTVDFPTDFVTPELAGKKAVYDVKVVEVKVKVLPELNDLFAKDYGAENLEKLRAGVRTDLEKELNFKKSKSVRSQLIRALLDSVNFDLPETAVQQQTRQVVYDIVHENSKRGVQREIIENQKEQIYSAAAQGAKERVKVAFLLQKIAEKEDIKVSQEEIAQRITAMAAMSQMPPEKLAKDLQKRNGLIEIYDQIMNEKVMDLLQEHAVIEDVAPEEETEMAGAKAAAAAAPGEKTPPEGSNPS